MPDLIHNERAKLVASAFDRVSTMCIAMGVFAPLTTLMLSQNQNNVPLDQLLAAFGFWIFAAVIFHVEARLAIETLKE
jgi:hypothetical protein